MEGEGEMQVLPARRGVQCALAFLARWACAWLSLCKPARVEMRCGNRHTHDGDVVDFFIDGVG